MAICAVTASTLLIRADEEPLHALLVDYSSVYYVNAVTNEYHWFSIDPGTGSLKDEGGGEDFFQKMAQDAEEVIYEEDKHILTEDIRKDRLMHKMKDGIMQSIVYRLMIDGKPVYHTLRMIRGVSEGDDYFILGVLNIDAEVRAKRDAEQLEREREIFNQIEYRLMTGKTVVYVRLSAMYTKDKRHLLFCVENIDEQVRALQSANELARTDELTGTNNKNAYQEMEGSLQARIDAGEALDFAIVVCDMNNLKHIDDTLGHKTGDAYIRAVSKLVCGIFFAQPRIPNRRRRVCRGPDGQRLSQPGRAVRGAPRKGPRKHEYNFRARGRERPFRLRPRNRPQGIRRL